MTFSSIFSAFAAFVALPLSPTRPTLAWPASDRRSTSRRTSPSRSSSTSVVSVRGTYNNLIMSIHWFGQYLKCLQFRYLNPPSHWIACALESRELMALCLKKLKHLSDVRLVDANFIWTEPHSKRIKVFLLNFTTYHMT